MSHKHDPHKRDRFDPRNHRGASVWAIIGTIIVIAFIAALVWLS